jgi:hypothetical protein
MQGRQCCSSRGHAASRVSPNRDVRVRTCEAQVVHLLAPALKFAHYARSEDLSDLCEVWNVSAVRSANMAELWPILSQ